jgi:beta-lactam-binding protein with PASTA domain
LFKKLTHKPFWVNLLAAIGLALLLLVVFFLSLSWLTGHNDVKKVPSVTGMNIDDATKLLQAQGFSVSVQDSIYVDTIAKAAVVRQSPDVDADVKSGRTVYLTINRTVAPLVDMPDLRGFSFLSAQLYLHTIGLKLGDTTYSPDISRNAVKEQLYNGQPITAGTKINMGSAISLVLGDGVSDDAMDVPDLTGMSLTDAQQYLSTMNISLGDIVANPDVKDSANAFVYKQAPSVFSTDSTGANTKNKIGPGQKLNVWLSVEPPVRDTAQTTIQPK